MRKLYSLIAAVIFAATVNAQGTENFDSRATTGGSSYTTANFSGEDNTSWSLADGRIVAANTTDISISGITTMIRNGAGGLTITFPNGIGTLDFKYKKAFTGAANRTIKLYVDGTLLTETLGFGAVSGSQPAIYNFSQAINKKTSVVVKVEATGGQVSIDDFSWTASTLSVVDTQSKRVELVKNTMVDQEIVFDSDAQITIFNMNGQVVKSTKVTKGTVLNVAELTKGMYIVKGNVDGKLISQKIIKK